MKRENCDEITEHGTLKAKTHQSWNREWYKEIGNGWLHNGDEVKPQIHMVHEAAMEKFVELYVEFKTGRWSIELIEQHSKFLKYQLS